MPDYILKVDLDPDRDFYVVWSTEDEKAVMWGTREEVLAYVMIDHEYLRKAAYALQRPTSHRSLIPDAEARFAFEEMIATWRMNRAVESGTSSYEEHHYGFVAEYLVVQSEIGRGVLKRGDLRAFLESNCDPGLLEPPPTLA